MIKSSKVSIMNKVLGNNNLMGSDGVLVSSAVFKTVRDRRARSGEFDSHTVPPNLTYDNVLNRTVIFSLVRFFAFIYNKVPGTC